MSFFTGLNNFLRMVKFSHTIFAMPFAITGFVLAIETTEYQFSWKLFFLVVIAMISARNAAMGFNRFLDRDIDAKNPRTASRELPQKILTPFSVLVFIFLNAIIFIVSAYFINPLCFYLSFPVVALLFLYSAMKRFTALCHYVLGLALSIAPTGAYLSVTGKFALSPVILSAIVLLWVSGFDIIYALLDTEHDRENNLHSIPGLFGIKSALGISAAGHLFIVPLLILFGIITKLGWIYYMGAFMFTLMLFWQHMLVSSQNLNKVNAAFFTANGFASVLFAIFTIAALIFN